MNIRAVVAAPHTLEVPGEEPTTEPHGLEGDEPCDGELGLTALVSTYPKRRVTEKYSRIRGHAA